MISKDLEHLLWLSRRGANPGASSGEKQARSIVLSLVDDAIGLDGAATRGITDLVELVQSNPMDGRELVREKAGIE